jgi:hypothetical protein
MSLGSPVAIEIIGKDEFWARAFHVEWQDQFPSRVLSPGPAGVFWAQADWMPDLQSVAAQCYCTILLAPEYPQRREWFKSLLPR